MINTTKGELVFLKTGEELHESVLAALHDASSWMLQAYQLQDIDLSVVTTKNYLEAAFPAHIQRFVLRDVGKRFDEQYVGDVLAFVSASVGHCSPNLYAAVTRTPLIASDGREEYRKSYLPSLRRGFSTFLVALHVHAAIVLPFSFCWPRGYYLGAKGAITGTRNLCPLKYLPEMLRFMRSFDYREGAQQAEDVFSAYTSKQRERFVWMFQRLTICVDAHRKVPGF